jgi:hypothetical protein
MSIYNDQIRDKEEELELPTVLRHDGTSLPDILRFNGKDVSYPSKEAEKDRGGNILSLKDVSMRAQDINHSGTLRKYAKDAKVNLADLISLHTDVKPHALGLDQFLANKYTDRYKDEYLGFKGQKLRYVFCEYTMEQMVLTNKVERYMRGERTFVNMNAAFLYVITYKNKKIIKEVNRSLERIAGFERLEEKKDIVEEEGHRVFTVWQDEFRPLLQPIRDALLKQIEQGRDA